MSERAKHRHHADGRHVGAPAVVSEPLHVKVSRLDRETWLFIGAIEALLHEATKGGGTTPTDPAQEETK